MVLECALLGPASCHERTVMQMCADLFDCCLCCVGRQNFTTDEFAALTAVVVTMGHAAIGHAVRNCDACNVDHFGIL